MAVKVISAETVFEMHDTYGMPFEITFELMARRRCVCNLRELLRICVEHGWNREKAFGRINDAWRDVYPVNPTAFREWCGA